MSSTLSNHSTWPAYFRRLGEDIAIDELWRSTCLKFEQSFVGL